VNTKEDKKDIKMLKNKLWKRRIFTEAEIVMFRRNQIVKDTTLLKKSKRTILENKKCKRYPKKKTNKHRMKIKWRKRPIFLTTRKFKNKSYRKITN